MIIIMRREGKGSEVKKRRNWMECLSLPLSSLSFIYTYIHTYIHIRREGYIHTTLWPKVIWSKNLANTK